MKISFSIFFQKVHIFAFYFRSVILLELIVCGL